MRREIGRSGGRDGEQGESRQGGGKAHRGSPLRVRANISGGWPGRQPTQAEGTVLTRRRAG